MSLHCLKYNDKSTQKISQGVASRDLCNHAVIPVVTVRPPGVRISYHHTAATLHRRVILLYDPL